MQQHSMVFSIYITEASKFHFPIKILHCLLYSSQTNNFNICNHKLPLKPHQKFDFESIPLKALSWNTSDVASCSVIVLISQNPSPED